MGLADAAAAGSANGVGRHLMHQQMNGSIRLHFTHSA